MKERYALTIIWSEGDDCFAAFCPEFPGLSAFGATPAAALKEATIALELFLDEIRASGKEPPAPRTLGAYSGQFRVRLPRWLHASLAGQAELESVSLNSLVISYLAAAVGQAQLKPHDVPVVGID